MPGAVVFGVVGGSVEQPQVEFLHRPVSVDAVTELAEGVSLGEVVRIGAACETSGCVHFDGDHCGLGQRVATMLPPVVQRLPRCSMRSSCRWYAEQGGSVCLRCPQVMTTDYPRPGNDLVRLAATPVTTEPL
jgi:hypothetical protein